METLIAILAILIVALVVLYGLDTFGQWGLF